MSFLTEPYRAHQGTRTSHIPDQRTTLRTSQTYDDGDQGSYVERFIRTFRRDQVRNDDLVAFWQNMHNAGGNRNYSFNEECLRAIIDHTFMIVDQLKLSDLSRVACSFAKLGCRDRRVEEIRKVTISSLVLDDHLNPSAFASIARAFVLMKYYDPKLIESFKNKIAGDLKALNRFNGRDLSCLAWAFASFGCNYKKDKPLLNAIKCAVSKFENLTPKDLSSILWAFVKFKCNDEKFINGILDGIYLYLKSQSEFEEADLCKILSSIVEFKSTEAEYLDLIVSVIKDKLINDDKFNESELAKIMFTISQVEQTENILALKSALENSIIRKMQSSFRILPGSFYGQNLGNLLFSLQKSKNHKCIKAVMQKFAQVLKEPSFFVDGFLLSSVALTTSQLHYVDLTFVNSLRNRISEEIVVNGFFDETSLSKLSYFLCCFGLNGDDELLNKYFKAVRDKIDNATFSNLNDLVNVAWAFVMLGKADEYSHFIPTLFRLIEYAYYKETISESTLIRLLKTYDVLSLETIDVQIPWSEKFLSEIESNKKRYIAANSVSISIIDDICNILETIDLRTIMNCPHPQITIQKVLYESGFFIDIAILGNRNVAVEINSQDRYFMNTGTLKQKYLTKFRVLRNAGWSVLEVTEFIWKNMDDRQKYDYLVTQLQSLNAEEDIEDSFEDLGIEDEQQLSESQYHLVPPDQVVYIAVPYYLYPPAGYYYIPNPEAYNFQAPIDHQQAFSVEHDEGKY